MIMSDLRPSDNANEENKFYWLNCSTQYTHTLIQPIECVIFVSFLFRSRYRFSGTGPLHCSNMSEDSNKVGKKMHSGVFQLTKTRQPDLYSTELTDLALKSLPRSLQFKCYFGALATVAIGQFGLGFMLKSGIGSDIIFILLILPLDMLECDIHKNCKLSFIISQTIYIYTGYVNCTSVRNPMC